MKTSPTSSLSSDTLAALFDELEKIAEVRKDESFKRTLKNVALTSLGAAAGTGAAMLGHEVLKKTLGARYDKLLPSTKMRIIAPALALATSAMVGAGIALKTEMEKRPEAKNG